MSDTQIVWASLSAVAITIIMMFPAGRGALASLLGLLWAGAVNIGGLLINQGQAFVRDMWEAHVTVFQNFMPRNSVLPSVRQDTVRRS